MKNLIYSSLILFFIFQFSVSNAQDTLKSFNNRWSTELNFNPFNGNLSFNNAKGQIKLRYFESNGMAWRMAVNLNFDENKSNVKNVYGSNPYETEKTQKTFLIGITVGREKHFSGTRRMSPYIGWEVATAFKSSSEKTEEETRTTEVKGAWITYIPSGQYSSQSFTERGYWSLGANFVTGFDFYVSKNFYLGYEIVVGLNRISYSDIDITEKGTNPSSNSLPDFNESSWKFGPQLTNGIRIGYVF